MNEEPKSIWKKSWAGPSWLGAWLILVVATFFTILFITFFLPGGPRSFWDCVPALTLLLGVSLVIATVVVGLWLFIGWLWCGRNFKRLLLGLACFATLIGLFYAVENFRGKLAWNSFKQEWEAKGEKFDWQAFVPPPVPDDQNFALAPIWIESIKATLGPTRARLWFGDKFPDQGRTNFTERLRLEIWHERDNLGGPSPGDWHKAERTDLKAWQDYYRATNRSAAPGIFTNDFPVASLPQSPAQDVLLALSKHDAALEELRQASRLAYSRFPLQYDAEDLFSVLLPHLSALKRGSQALRLRAVAELQNRQAVNALDDVKLALRLADSVRSEPFLITHLVRISLLDLTLQPVWEGLAEHRWSDEQLVALDAELARSDFLADYEFSERAELGAMPNVLEYRRRTRDPDFLFDYTVFGISPKHTLEKDVAVFVFRHCPGGWFYQNQIRYCRFVIQNFLPTIDAPRQLAFPAAANRASDAQLKEVAHLNPYNFIEYRLLFPPFDFFKRNKLAGQFAYAQSSVDLARTALALERHRLAHSQYPETLDALVPQFIETLPHDIIGGQPLHYRRTDGGKFLLYSIGWNETDDGGIEPPKNKSGNPDWEKGDWVWGQQAK